MTVSPDTQVTELTMGDHACVTFGEPAELLGLTAGAIARLTPPWLPVTVAAEAASLRDGRAVLALPGGLRWEAQHDPGAYDPPRRFADELASMPLRVGLAWRHVHEFSIQSEVAELINVPLGTLKTRMFAAMWLRRHLCGTARPVSGQVVEGAF